MHKFFILTLSALLSSGPIAAAKDTAPTAPPGTTVSSPAGTAANATASREVLLEPDGTYIYGDKAGEKLYLDIYMPAEGSPRNFGNGRPKPAILFIFGGGFKNGERDSADYNPWFRSMTANGYPVVSIDYRLGMRGKSVKGLLKQSDAIHAALELAMEDLFSATLFLVENSAELGIDPRNLVLSGSSAGAMTALRAEYEICNRGRLASVLPEDFNYAGIMSFAGAVLSFEGALHYDREPAPTLLVHGTADKLVNYKKIRLFKRNLSGSDALAAHYHRNGYNFRIYRFRDNGHEICNTMQHCLPYELDFLGQNVGGGQKKVVDALIDDPSVPKGKRTSVNDLYGN